MRSKRSTIFGCAAAALSLFGAVPAFAQEAAGGDSGENDAAQMRLLRAELDYSTALIYAALPDFAEDVIKAAKARWPEADTLAFAIEIRGMLALGKYDEAEKKIASLPDRKSAKYWAARLEVANNYYFSGKRDDCKKIYFEFFKAADGILKAKNPDKALVEIARDARYQYGQLLLSDELLVEAAQQYAQLLDMLHPKLSDDDDAMWCNIAAQTADIHLRLASEGKKLDKGQLDQAKKYIDKLLWRQDMPLFFGRAIAMKAYYELLNGSVEKAQTVVNDYMEQLKAIHEQIEKADPTGREGLLAQSPMPQCRYLMAEKYWREAQNEFKKPKHDDEKIKTLLFGAKKKSGKGRDGQGAFNNAVNVYLRYPQSIWAPKAGKLQSEIAKFAQEKYGANIQTHETPEQRARVVEAQFQRANELYATEKFDEAEKAYYAVLADYPEIKLSLEAAEKIAAACLDRITGAKGDGKADLETKKFWRMKASAIEGYLAERFARHKETDLMTAAGNAVLRLAAKEKEMENTNRSLGETNRASNLYYEFSELYTSHAMGAQMAFYSGAAAQLKAMPKDVSKTPDPETAKELFREAVKFYLCVTNNYASSSFRGKALAQLSTCYEKLGEDDLATAALSEYVASIDEKTQPLLKVNADMNLQTRRLKAGLLKLAGVDDLPREKRAAARKDAIKEIALSAKSYEAIAERAKKFLDRPDVTKVDKERFAAAIETAYYMAGDACNRLPGTEKEVEAYRKRAVKYFEACLAVAPEGKNAPIACEKLGRIHSQLGDIDASRQALMKLRQDFPKSASAKRALPQLARALVDHAKTVENPEEKAKLIAEVRDIYGDMLSNQKGSYSAHDLVRAGDMLLEADSNDLALLAYQKAEEAAKAAKSKRNLSDARLGLARGALKSGDIQYARNILDSFLEDESLRRSTAVMGVYEMMMTVAVKQAEKESDAVKRRKLFGDAIGAAKSLRGIMSRAKDANGKRKTPGWQIDEITLKLVDIYIVQMETERSRGNQEGSDKAMLSANTVLERFLENNSPTAEYPLSEFSDEARKNYESALYANIEILNALNSGDGKQLDDVAALCRQYLESFPKAAKERVDHVNHILAGAIERGAKSDAPAEPAAEPAPVPVAETPAPTSEGENK